MRQNPPLNLGSQSDQCRPCPHPANAGLLPILLPGMFPAVSPPFEAWPEALLSSLGSLPQLHPTPQTTPPLTLPQPL